MTWRNHDLVCGTTPGHIGDATTTTCRRIDGQRLQTTTTTTIGLDRRRIHK